MFWTITSNTKHQKSKNKTCEGMHTTASPHTHTHRLYSNHINDSQQSYRMPGMFNNKIIFSLSCFPDFSVLTRIIVSCLYSNRPLRGKCLSVCCGLNYISPMTPIKSKSSSPSDLIWDFHGHFHQMYETHDKSIIHSQGAKLTFACTSQFFSSFLLFSNYRNV